MSGGGGGFDPFRGIGDAFSGAVNSVGHAFESVVQGVGKVGQKILDDPLPIIEAAALTYMTGGLGAAAAEGLLAGEVAAGTISASTMAAVGTGISASISSAAVTALNGGDVSQIATAGTIAGLTAGLAQGLSSTEALKAVTSSMSDTFGPAIASATGRSIAGAVGAILQGKDPLTGAASGAVAGALTSSLSSNDLDGLSKAAVNVLGVSAGAATSSAIMGRSAAEAFGSSLLGSSIKLGLSAAMNEVKGLTGTEDIPQAIKQIQEKSQADLATYTDSVAKVQPLIDEFKSARDTYTALDGYRKGESTNDLQGYLTDRAQANAGEQKLKVDENGQLVADNTPFKTNDKYEAQLAALGVPKDAQSGTVLPGVTSDTLQSVVNKMQDLNTQITPLAKNFTDAQSALNTTNKQFTDISNELTKVQTLTGQYTNALTNYQNALDPVSQMYQKYYGRDPTAAELDYWGIQRATAHSLEDIENSIKTSPEATNYAPLASNTTSDQPTPLVKSDTKGVSPEQAAFISPYILDANGNLMYDANGQPIPNPLANQATSDKGITSTYTNNTATSVRDPSTGDSYVKSENGEIEVRDGEGNLIKTLPVGSELPYFNNPSDVLNVINGAEKTTPATTGGVGSVTTPSTPGTSTNLPSDTGNGTTSPTPMPIIDLPSTGSTGSTGTGGTGSTGTGGIGSTGTGSTGTGSTGTGSTGTGSTGTGSTGTGIAAGLGAIAGLGGSTGTGGTSAQQQYNQDTTAGLTNLTPGLTKSMNTYSLSGLPIISEPETQSFATGGSSTNSSSLFDSQGNYNYGNVNDTPLSPGLTKSQISYILSGLPVLNKAQGGIIHNPEFYSEGGASMANRYVKGDGDGTSDSVPAMLANGEFVIPADVVSSLGNGSNDSGAKVLDEFLRVIRDHKRKADAKHLPPDSKGPLSYLTDAKRKVRK